MTEPDSRSTPLPDAEIERRFWNSWNAEHRETKPVATSSERQSAMVLEWLAETRRTDLRIVDFGCGSGWLCSRMLPFGRVTGVDLSDEVLARARVRYPAVEFIAGDVAKVPTEVGTFDVVVSLEVLAHVPDQPAYIERVATLLRPGGVFLLASQNPLVLSRTNTVKPPKPGQRRRWVSIGGLRRLLRPWFAIEHLTTIVPTGRLGFLRIVNSYKLNGALDRILGPTRVASYKERLGLGQTIVIRARKRT